MTGKFDFIISVDRTLMTTHHDREFVGFMTTGPAVLLPERLWMWLSAPKAKKGPDGLPKFAPYGLRKIEAALLDAGYSAAIVDPDDIPRYAAEAKAFMIGHHDYFAFNPPSSEWWLVTGREPVNRKSLLKFMSTVAEVKRSRNPGLKIIAGGPAAWQWLYVPHYVEQFAVDTIVDGEAEKAVVQLAKAVVDGSELPRYLSVAPRDSPKLDEINKIKGASVNGLIEIMRGCPRGCKFCNVTLRPLRYIPLEDIEEELKVNRAAGIRAGILHSEDVLLYGADGIHPRPEPLLKLHELAKRYYDKSVTWSHASLAAVVSAEREHGLIRRLSELLLRDEQSFLGFQTGIETGSPRLARVIMPAKASPYPADKWPDVVEEAFSILHDNHMVPAATIILGLPGEVPDDLTKTMELMDRLKDYRSMIVPMFFVPMGVLRREDWFRSVSLNREHAELMVATMRHSVRWAKDIVNKFYLKGVAATPMRSLIMYFLNRAAKFSEGLTPEKVLDYIEDAKERMSSERSEEPVLSPLRKRLEAALASS
ncbi:MAG: radical SAM protein, partial [Conexivisphaerales archaeon]|nr:radical SAM protein [Conexivisphaerales archaeon]